MESTFRSIPAWMNVIVAVTLLCISTWALKGTFAPQSSWFLLQTIGVKDEPPMAYIVMDRHSGRWCAIGLVDNLPKPQTACHELK
jgi:hypothetical protein